MRLAIAALAVIIVASPAIAAPISLSVDRVYHIRSYIHVIIKVSNDTSYMIKKVKIGCSAFDGEKRALGEANNYAEQVVPGQPIVVETLIDAPPDTPDIGLSATCRAISIE